jgi:ribosome maturation factor RimP
VGDFPPFFNRNLVVMIEAKITEILTGLLSAKNIAIVQISFKKNILQILLERSTGESVSIDDCTEISRLTSRVLDVEDFMPGNYMLEVSSAGLDRPLVTKDDYIRFKGKQARIALKEKIMNFKKIKGTILAVEEETIIIKDDNYEHSIHLSNILSAALIPEIKFN